MKRVFVVYVIEKSGKYHAFADGIRTGENLKALLQRHKGPICHLCESRTQAETLAHLWNDQYKKNKTNLY